MRRLRVLGIILVIVGLAASCSFLSDGEQLPQPQGKLIVGYFPGWSVLTRNFRVGDLDARKLTHVIYAFANISDDGLCMVGNPEVDLDMEFDGDDPDDPFKGNFHQLKILKEKYPLLWKNLNLL